MLATVAAYACMALEAWVILRASGTPVSAVGALAIETFSRVASFASAFIPANLGALEAFSLAAVAAIGLAGGGAALALARRLRGLFCRHRPRYLSARHAAAVGRVRPTVQPRTTCRMLRSAKHGRSCSSSRVIRPHAFRQAHGSRACRPVNGSCDRRRAGYRRVIVLDLDATGAGRSRLFANLARQLDGVTVAHTAADWRRALGDLDPSEAVTAIGAGTVVSPRCSPMPRP